MLNFEYKGISYGKYVEGEIEALNNSEAAHKLKEQKVIITKLVQTKKKKEIKKKEKTSFSFGTGVVRIVETYGRNSKGSLRLQGTAVECNLMEWEDFSDPVSVENELALDLSPFEIKTYKVRFR